MPQTTPKSSQLLGIRLQGDVAEYAPGDTIVGCVFRKTYVVSPNALVQISLHGRTKSKMVVTRGGNSSSTYRGRFTLIDERDSALKIFQGPLHIPSLGEQMWPFAITIPLHPNPKFLALGVLQEQSYLPLDPGHVATQALPSTFKLDSTGGSTEGFIEYFLKAELRASRDGSVDVTDAVLPLRVVNLSVDPPIADLGLRASREPRSVASYRLVPGMQETELSISQKMKQSLNFSSVPAFWFTAEIEAPTRIQLENPNPIPFRIRVVPNFERTSEIIQGVPHKVRLTSVHIRVEVTTEIRCEGTFSPHHKTKTREIDLLSQGVIPTLTKPIWIPCTNEWPPIDIGALANLRFGRRGRIGPVQPRYGPDVYPTFTTYNIRHSHRLTWYVRGNIAGEGFYVSGGHPVALLMASDERGQGAVLPAEASSRQVTAPSTFEPGERSVSWIQPPPWSDGLPTFAEVRQEDERLRSL
ncbi:hypothetical protein QQZ08_004386 [Neonectria magnoliae]|uniref:Arrestin-like N-terminal domain-containing protein n=1 Tax=Neonectria magnoliae TaxID=2732573 RepID=A0ABR1I770_9HYPO